MLLKLHSTLDNHGSTRAGPLFMLKWKELTWRPSQKQMVGTSPCSGPGSHEESRTHSRGGGGVDSFFLLTLSIPSWGCRLAGPGSASPWVFQSLAWAQLQSQEEQSESGGCSACPQCGRVGARIGEGRLGGQSWLPVRPESSPSFLLLFLAEPTGWKPHKDQNVL